jgi:AAA15 family ATPase/GTPase
MLKKISIKNFKSIEEDTIELGRINVFIGANGCGKSNILEAISFGSAIEDNGKIHNSDLIDKGVRIAKPSLLRNSFFGTRSKDAIEISFDFGENK